MTSRFFVENEFRSGTVSFSGAEFHHMIRVTRHQVGDTVRLFDGTGREADAQLTFVTRHAATLDVSKIETIPEETGPRLSIAIPVPKASRAGWLIEKAVELGVKNIIPLKTSRSVVDPRSSKLDTLRQNIVAASKQCGRSRLMTISPVVEWADFLKKECTGKSVVVAHPGGASFTGPLVRESLAEAAAKAKTKKAKANPEMIAVVGPEGGFTVEEITQAVSKGGRLVSLGPRLLRVETAGVMMASVFVSAQLMD
jgi:16S rRNA (uracil1498-N3)-methyltransferase